MLARICDMEIDDIRTELGLNPDGNIYARVAAVNANSAGDFSETHPDKLGPSMPTLYLPPVETITGNP